MKLLLFSDLHADVGAAQRLVEHAQAMEVLVGAGDFGNVRRQVRICLDVLRAVGGNKALTSRHLGLDRKTLYRKLKEYSIAEERAAAESAAATPQPDLLELDIQSEIERDGASASGASFEPERA